MPPTMDPWRDVPVFGVRRAATQPTPRPSAYALIADGSRRIAAVRTGAGVFLPGGGIEPGETPEVAAARETLEECGVVVRLPPETALEMMSHESHAWAIAVWSRQ